MPSPLILEKNSLWDIFRILKIPFKDQEVTKTNLLYCRNPFFVLFQNRHAYNTPIALRANKIIGFARVVICRILKRKPTTSREMAILKGVLKIFFSVSIKLFLRFIAFQFCLSPNASVLTWKDISLWHQRLNDLDIGL